jgi:hypothetical protein
MGTAIFTFSGSSMSHITINTRKLYFKGLEVIYRFVQRRRLKREKFRRRLNNLEPSVLAPARLAGSPPTGNSATAAKNLCETTQHGKRHPPNTHTAATTHIQTTSHITSTHLSRRSPSQCHGHPRTATSPRPYRPPPPRYSLHY